MSLDFSAFGSEYKEPTKKTDSSRMNFGSFDSVLKQAELNAQPEKSFFEKQRSEGLAAFGIKEPPGTMPKISAPELLGGPGLGFQFKPDYGKPLDDAFVAAQEFPDELKKKLRLERGGKEDFESTLLEIDHIVSQELGGTKEPYNAQALLSPDGMSDADTRQEGKMRVEWDNISKYKAGLLTQGQAVYNILQYNWANDAKKKEIEAEASKNPIKEAMGMAVKEMQQKAKDIGSGIKDYFDPLFDIQGNLDNPLGRAAIINIAVPFDILHRTGLQVTAQGLLPVEGLIGSFQKLTGEPSLKDVSYDEIWSNATEHVGDLMLDIGSPAEALKMYVGKEPKPIQIPAMEQMRESAINDWIEADKNDDLSKSVSGFTKMFYADFAENWANPFYLFSIKGVSNGSFKMTPRERVIAKMELNPAKEQFAKGQKIKPTEKVYQIKTDQTNVAAEITKKGKIKTVKPPDVKMYVSQAKDGTVKIKVTNSGGEILNKNFAKEISRNPELLQSAQTRIVDNLVLKQPQVQRALTDVSSKVNMYLTGDPNKMTPLGKQIANMKVPNVDSPGKLYTEIAKVIKADKTLGAEATKELLGQPVAGSKLARTGLGGTIQDFFLVMKDPQLAAMPGMTQYEKIVETSLKVIDPGAKTAPGAAKAGVKLVEQAKNFKTPKDFLEAKKQEAGGISSETRKQVIDLGIARGTNERQYFEEKLLEGGLTEKQIKVVLDNTKKNKFGKYDADDVMDEMVEYNFKVLPEKDRTKIIEAWESSQKTVKVKPPAVKTGTTEEATLFRGDLGKVVEEAKKFENIVTVPGNQATALKELATQGDKKAGALLADSKSSFIAYDKYLDKVYKDQGFDAIKYTNENIKGKEVEFRETATGFSYSPDKAVAQVYAKGTTPKRITEIKIPEVKPKDAKVPEAKIKTPRIKRVPEPKAPEPKIPEFKTSTLAKKVEAKAIEQGLTGSLGELPQYAKVSMKDQAAEVAKFWQKDPQAVIDIALGRTKPPENILPESAFVAAEKAAIKTGDIELLRDLANSKLAGEATLMGQRIRTLGERDPNSVVSVVRKIKEARKKTVRKKGEKVTEKTKQTRKEIRKALKEAEPKKDEWLEFINEIEC